MSASKLHKQLVRELTANPKKAAALGLLAAVAIYFWLPLILGGDDKKPAKKPVANEQPGQAAPVATAVAQRSVEKRVGWQKVVSWIDSDPLTHTVAELPLKLEAFGAAQAKLDPEPVTPDPREQVDVEPAPEVTPDSLGLRLQGTLVGPRRRVALINNRPCGEGSTFWITEELGFRVVEVTPRSVILAPAGDAATSSNQGTQYELTVDKAKQAGLFEMWPSQDSDE